MSENSIADRATWLNTFVGIVGIIVTIVALAGVSITLFFKEYWVETVIAGQGAIIALLLVLIYFNSKNNIRIVPRRNKGISDEKFFRAYFSRKRQELSKGLDKLSSGSLVIAGEQVQGAQIELITLLENSVGDKIGETAILAVDITTSPELIRARNPYFEKNKEFIKRGGEIKRVFVASKENLSQDNFFSSLMDVMKRHEEVGVVVGFQILEDVDVSDRRDFICYGSSAVINEARQADKGYKDGYSHIHFLSDKIEELREVHNRLWSEGATNSAKNDYLTLKKYSAAKANTGTSISFDYAEYRGFSSDD